MLVRELRPNQERCFEQAKKAYEKNPNTNFLVAAKCRFGKTFTALKIAFDAWNAKDLVLVVSGFKSVEQEWREEYERSFKDRKADFDFHTLQGLNVAKDFNDIHNLKERRIILIFDEAHFAERTLRTKEIVDYLQPDNILYLTATPYTNSLAEQFGEAFEEDFSKGTIFKYSIQQEIEEYTEIQDFKEKYNYIPVRLGLVGIEETVRLYKKANGDEIWGQEAVERFKQALEDRGCKTFIYFTTSNKQCKDVYEAFKAAGIKGANISGKGDDARNVENIKKRCKEAKDNNEFFGVFSCKRGGTGVTWEGLDAVVFYNAPSSAIDFIQKSYRCANPCNEPLKDKAYVFCLNKESALNAYLQINANEARLKGVSARTNFESFQATITLEGEFSEKSFEELEAEVTKNFRYQLFEVPTGVQLRSFATSDLATATKAPTESDKTSNNSKKQKTTQDSENSEAAEKVEAVVQEDTESEQEKQKRIIFEKYVALFEVVDYALATHPELLGKIEIRNVEKYPNWLKSKVETNFTLEDWLKLLNSDSFGVERARVYIKEEKEKEEMEKPSIEGKEKFVQELQGKYLELSKEVLKTERDSGLQADLKDWLYKNQGPLFRTTSKQDVEFCHIISFKDLNAGKYKKEAAYDPYIGLLLPVDVHAAWDAKAIEAKVLEDGRLQFVVKNEKRALLCKDKKVGDDVGTSDIVLHEMQQKYLKDKMVLGL